MPANHSKKNAKSQTVSKLKRAIVAGENDTSVNIAHTLTDMGMKTDEIIIKGVTTAMEHLDKKCTVEEFCLLELMLAGRAAMDVIDYLCSNGMMDDKNTPDACRLPKEKIILGTIKGDIHEIGKNIFAMVLRSHGYQVIDIGKDVEPVDFVIAANDQKAQYIAISSLITSTISYLKEVRKYVLELGEEGPIKIIAGGAALKQSRADYLNVDYVANTAFDGLHYIQQASHNELSGSH